MANRAEDKELVFHGSNGLWITLVVLAVAALALTSFVVVSDLIMGNTNGTLRALVTGGGLAALLGLGAWFIATQRREVVLDEEGITIRTPGGVVRTAVPWTEVRAIDARPLPSQRMSPAVFIARLDGTSLLIDPQQVSNTGTLAREARRLHESATRRAR